MTALGAFAKVRLDTASGDFLACHPVSHIEHAQLLQAIQNDARGALQKALLSFASAMNGLRENSYSWSTVQLYYSIFYSLTVILICNRVGLFYYNRKPGLIEVRPGGSIRKLTRSEAAGGSHGSCLEVFRRQFPSHLLQTPIGGNEPLGWIKALREKVHYSDQKFSEPEIPMWFRKSVGSNDVRRLASAYSNDSFYSFDPDHAAIAFPMLALKLAANEAKASSAVLEDSDRQYICNMMADQKGRLSTMIEFLAF